MAIPDVIGFTLDEAKSQLLKSELVIDRIVVLSPPREKTSEYDGNFRVIRVLPVGDNKLELQICKPL